MDSLIRFRVATSEKARYEEASRRMGQSLSAWARDALDAQADCDLEEGTHTPPRMVGYDDTIKLPLATEKLTGKLLPEKPAASEVTRPDPDKLAAFQRKMAGKK